VALLGNTQQTPSVRKRDRRQLHRLFRERLSSSSISSDSLAGFIACSIDRRNCLPQNAATTAQIPRELSASENLNLPNNDNDTNHPENRGDCCHNENYGMLKGMTKKGQSVSQPRKGEEDTHQRHNRIKCVEVFREQSHGLVS